MKFEILNFDKQPEEGETEVRKIKQTHAGARSSSGAALHEKTEEPKERRRGGGGNSSFLEVCSERFLVVILRVFEVRLAFLR